MASPRYDVRRFDVVIDLDIGRSDDCLTMIVCFRRHRQDRLSREFRIPLNRFCRLRSPSVERRQVFRRRVVDDVLRIESAYLYHTPGLRQQRRNSPRRREHDQVVQNGLDKGSPREPLRHEYVRPKGIRRRGGVNRRQLAAEKEIAEVTLETAAPGFQFDQQTQRRGASRPCF